MPAVPRCRLNGVAGLAAERSSVWTSYVAGAVQASLHLIWTLTALPALHQPEPPYPDQSRSVKWFPPRVQLVIVCQRSIPPIDRMLGIRRPHSFNHVSFAERRPRSRRSCTRGSCNASHVGPTFRNAGDGQPKVRVWHASARVTHMRALHFSAQLAEHRGPQGVATFPRDTNTAFPPAQARHSCFACRVLLLFCSFSELCCRLLSRVHGIRHQPPAAS